MHRFELTAALVATGLLGLSFGLAGCGDDGGFQCGPGTMPVRGICLPEELDARRPPVPDGGLDMGPPVFPDFGPPPVPPPPPDLGPPPDLDMGPPPPPVDMGPPPPEDMGPPPVDMSLPPVDMSLPEVDMSLPPMDMGPPDDDMGPVEMDMGPVDMGPVDMGPVDTGPMGDAGPATTTPVRLLFTEIVVGPDARELVEIHNPNDFAVDLTRYFITDFENYGSFPAGAVPAMASGDVVAQFPPGSVIAPRDYIVVAMASAAGLASMLPGTVSDYELEGPPGGVPDLITSDSEGTSWRDSASVFFGNAAETVVLFYWDGVSDLVTDIDVVGWADAALMVPNKTGVSVDGPDPGTTPSAYNTDRRTLTSAGRGFAPGAGTTPDYVLVRCDLTEGAEMRSADANGVAIAGLRDDETTENLAVTWRVLFGMGTGVYSLGAATPSGHCD